MNKGAGESEKHDRSQQAMSMTKARLRVMTVLVSDVEREWTALDITSETGLYPATAYANLRRLLREGWLSARVETAEQYRERHRDAGLRHRGPYVTYWKLTRKGEVEAKIHLKHREEGKKRWQATSRRGAGTPTRTTRTITRYW